MQGTLFDDCSTTPHNRARERQRAAGRASYHRHRERWRARRAAEREQHREKERARHAAYREQHRDKLNARQRAAAQRHPERGSQYRLRSMYGLSPSDVDALLQQQRGGCAICGAAFGDKLRPCVDHDHGTGHVRGLLCRDCNTGMGILGDDAQRLIAAAAYLHFVPQK